MLVLTRKEDECIVIGRDIVVTVVQCAGKVVRLGITAPREVPIYRQEVFESIRAIDGEKCHVRANERRECAPPPMEFN